MDHSQYCVSVLINIWVQLF